MNKEAIRHTGTYPDIYLKDRQTLILRLRTAKKDMMQCKVIYFARTSPGEKKSVPMECVLRDELFDYYRAELKFRSQSGDCIFQIYGIVMKIMDAFTYICHGDI